MYTHPFLPWFEPNDYMVDAMTLGAVLDHADPMGYPVSGDDLARWRKALSS